MRIPDERALEPGGGHRAAPARSRSGGLTDQVVGLQRSAGNAAVVQLIRENRSVQRDPTGTVDDTEFQKNVSAGDWSKGIGFLTGLDDTAVVATVSKLKPGDREKLRQAAHSASSARLIRVLDGVAGKSVKVSQGEQVGGNTFGIRGAYSWQITPDSIVVNVGMQFKPDAGVTVPSGAWFGYIRSTWNHYSAVNQADPTQKKQIVFNPYEGAGHVIQVTNGEGRANAGHYYVGDSRAAQSVPHEFGHLIGLEDEYERDAADFQRVTDAPAPATAAPVEQAQAAARGLREALHAKESFFEKHKTAEHRRMGMVNAVLAANNIVPDYQRAENALTHQVAKQYQSLFSVELSADVMAQVDSDDKDISDWREQLVGSFQYTTTSIMGDMSDHSHPVEPRHVRAFAACVQQALGGTWAPSMDH
ncbi:hypothetical protein GCM10009765_21120 [Fodinicola feengrottensis]|uniref:Peptidase M43 pregnancy-associated plasma-A domain-containing protein n=1 Tax=Fodinicola feengrottensis TaxID=435914 RepID=A0ABN2GHR6_9ACTN